MFSLFSQPYPINNILILQLRKAALIGLFVGLFLLTFQPFGLNEWETAHKSLKILGFGAITFLITAFSFIICPQLFPRQFIEEEWTVGREILAVTLNVLLIAVANRLYLEKLMGVDSGLGWAGMILVTFLISIFPVTGLVFLHYITQLKRYSQAAAELPVYPSSYGIRRVEPTAVHISSELPDFTALTLVADNDKDKLTFLSEELLYIESSDNYCTVVYVKNNQLVKPLLRSSLSRLEKQIPQPRIVRCHRSYIVNLNRVERVTGNAQGYKLHLLDGQFQIPVARQYNDSLVNQLKS